MRPISTNVHSFGIPIRNLHNHLQYLENNYIIINHGSKCLLLSPIPMTHNHTYIHIPLLNTSLNLPLAVQLVEKKLIPLF